MSGIREVKEEDFKEICGLIKSKEELFLVFPSGSYPLTLHQVENLYEIRKDLTVLVENNKIIGFANFYDYEENKIVFIGNVIIDRSFRSKGYGKSLVSHMLNVAYEKYKLPEVGISVFNENTRALLLYWDLGFVPYEIEEKVNISGNKVAQINMKLTRKVWGK